MESKRPPIIWVNTLLFALTGFGALVLVPLYAYLVGFQTEAIIISVVFWLWSGLSITAGYHRLWSHKAWQAHAAVQWAFAIGGAMALQNSILHWCSDHRIHHKHVDDNDKDPYSAGHGLWYSHIGWMLREYHAHRYHDYRNVRDLQKNPVVMNQHTHYGKWVLATNLLLPALLGWLTGDILGMLLLAGVFRLVVVHHSTFFINSLAHLWGSQPYSDKHSSRDNGWLALFTYGEGYHNFHHTFENDFRNGIRWWHYDPTKWLIQLLAKLGLATDLRQVPPARIEATKLSRQLQLSQRLLAQHKMGAELLHKLEAEYEQLLETLQGYYDEKQRQLKLRKDELDRSARERLQELRRAFHQHKKQWQGLRHRYHAQLL